MAPTLVTLPQELLLLILEHLHSLEELHSLLLTCKYLYYFCNKTPRNIVFVLAYRSVELELESTLNSQLFLSVPIPKPGIPPTTEGEERSGVPESALEGNLLSSLKMFVDEMNIALEDVRGIWELKRKVLDELTSHPV